MKRPYSTTHYHCGCHIVEDRPNIVNLTKSIYCEDKVDPCESTRQTVPCLYLPVLTLRRIQASRLT